MAQEIRCLLNFFQKFNVQRAAALADNVTVSKYLTKQGKYIDEIVADYGKGLKNKFEICDNKILFTGSDGNKTSYVRDFYRGTIVTEDGMTRVAPLNLWQSIWNNAYRGL